MLTIDATDPKSGTAEFKATAVRIEKLSESVEAVSAAVDLVDLHPTTVATDDERAAVDALLGAPSPAGSVGERTEADGRVARGGHEPRGSSATCCSPALHALQSARDGSARAGSNYVCERLTVPPAEAYGVATFYAMFSRRAATDDGRARVRRHRVPGRRRAECA